MNKYAKTAILALIIVSATLMGGCLDSADKNDETLDRMVQLEAILTDPEISEEEKIAAYLLAHEAITGEKHGLNSEANATPDAPDCYLNCGYSDKRTDPINGVGSFKTWIGGVLERDNTTISGFTDPSLDRIKSIEIFLNNESVDKYVPIAGEERKVTTTIVGEWYVKTVATLDDGTILTFSSSLGGMKDMSDHPDYKSDKITVTGSGPFDARYIETDGRAMTRAEAKALCDELGIIWGDERDI